MTSGTGAGPRAGDKRQDSGASGQRLTDKYRRLPLGRWWIVCLATIPLLLAIIGSMLGDSGGSSGSSTPTTSTSSKSGISLAQLYIIRSDKNLTITGDLPSDDAKAALTAAVKAAFGDDANITDQMHVNATVKSLDFGKVDAVFKAAVPIPDFSILVNGDTITLTGTAATLEQKDGFEHAVTTTWSNLTVVDNVEIKASASSSGAPAPAPSTTPSAPTSGPPPTPGAPATSGGPAPAPTTSGTPTTAGAAASGSAAPAPPPADPCANLQDYIKAVTGGPISFGNEGSSVPPPFQQVLSLVAVRLKSCPNSRVTINGYADNAGSEAINIPLSQQRADAVAKFLVDQGVPSDHITAKGLGSANPIADNDTPEGRARNRRAEIVVS